MKLIYQDPNNNDRHIREIYEDGQWIIIYIFSYISKEDIRKHEFEFGLSLNKPSEDCKSLQQLDGYTYGVVIREEPEMDIKPELSISNYSGYDYDHLNKNDTECKSRLQSRILFTNQLINSLAYLSGNNNKYEPIWFTLCQPDREFLESLNSSYLNKYHIKPSISAKPTIPGFYTI